MKLVIIGERGIPAKYSGFSTLIEELAVRLVRDYGWDVTVYCRNQYYEDHSLKPVRHHGPLASTVNG